MNQTLPHNDSRVSDPPRLTLTVMVVCLFTYLMSLYFGFERVLDYLHFPTLRDKSTFLELWRFITPVVMHFSNWHIFLNLLAWWILASLFERRWGPGRLFWVFLCIAVVSNAVQYLAANERFGGLSGVVYGMFGYLWAYSRLNIRCGFRNPNIVAIQIVLWLVLGFSGLADELIGPMANMSHLGGLIVGLIMGCDQAATREP